LILVALLWAIVLPVRAAAQRPATAPAPRGPTPQVSMVRTDRPPTIDGRLDEPVWQAAALIDRLTQVEPAEGAEPGERTEIRLLYDTDFLYIGVRAWDADPRAIVATQMEPDADLDSDDRVSFVLDTFLDRRNAFFFQVNPRGAQVDGLIENSSRPRTEWDGIWRAEASVDDRGWVAEIAIPFKTLSFDPRATAWGFNLERVIRRRNEVLRWAGAARNKELTDIGEAGALGGISGIAQGLGVDVRPSLTARYLRDRVTGSDDTEVKPSLDVFYRITPYLTAALTVNTDFAETEVDEREINLTRFDLFFPEKRDFFLQDAGIFDFGGLERNGRPFFSRRIGIGPEDQVVDILAGGKLTGRVGRVKVGLLDVQTEASGELDAKNLFVGRAAVNVLEQSAVGVIVTHGDPTSNADNLLLGADFNYLDTRFLGDQVLAGVLWVQHSFSTGADDDQLAYGGTLEFPNEPVEVTAAFTEIQRNFRPALGFVNRRDIRQYEASTRYRFRPEPVRRVDTSLSGLVVTDTDDRLESGEVKLDAVRLQTHPGDNLRLGYAYTHERLEEEFRFRGQDVTVPPGRYDDNRVEASVETSDGRPLGVGLGVSWGEFFTGTRLEIKPTLAWRPSPYLFVAAEYTHNDVDLPQGDFTIRLARLRLGLRFSPRLSWLSLVQYDNVSRDVGFNSRLRWVVSPGNDVFLVVNQSWVEEENGGLRPAVTETAVKIAWTLRF